MKNIRKHIRSHKTLIDSEEPSFDHFKRFKDKLEKEGKKKQMVYYKFRHVVAAMILIPLALVSYLLINRYTDKPLVLGSVSDELRETEMYFKYQISYRYKDLNNLIQMGIVSDEEVMGDLNEMDDYYRMLQEDLAHNPHDERIIQAMITYYQHKIELLDKILNQSHEFGMNYYNKI